MSIWDTIMSIWDTIWDTNKLVWKAIFLFVSRYDIFWPAYISLAPILLLSIYAIYRIGLRIGRSDWDFDRVQRERKKERQKLIEELKQREKEYKQQLESMYEETRKQLMIEFQDRDRQLRQYKEELERYHESLRQRARALDDLEKKLNERENKINKYLSKIKHLENKLSELQGKRDSRKQELAGLYSLFKKHLQKNDTLTKETAYQAYKYLRRARRRRLF